MINHLKKNRFIAFIVPVLVGCVMLYIYIYETEELTLRRLFASIYTLSICSVIIYFIALNKEYKYRYKKVQSFIYFPFSPKEILLKEFTSILVRPSFLILIVINIILVSPFFLYGQFMVVLVFIVFSIITHGTLLMICTLLKYTFTEKYFDILYLSVFYLVAKVDLFYMELSDTVEQVLFSFSITTALFSPIFLENYFLLFGCLFVIALYLFLGYAYLRLNYYLN